MQPDTAPSPEERAVLIAAPWTNDAADTCNLADEIATAITQAEAAAHERERTAGQVDEREASARGRLDGFVAGLRKAAKQVGFYGQPCIEAKLELMAIADRYETGGLTKDVTEELSDAILARINGSNTEGE